MRDDRSVVRPDHVPDADAVKRVPFVELHDGRLQGIVSSGSSSERVYVSTVEAGSGDFYCRTNNGRRCGGLAGGKSTPYCSHIGDLVAEAFERYPPAFVRRYVGVDPESDVDDVAGLFDALEGDRRETEDSEVFNRFRGHLAFVDREATGEPVPEMAWFVA